MWLDFDVRDNRRCTFYNFLLSTFFLYFHTQHHNTISKQNTTNVYSYSKSFLFKKKKNKSFLYIITYIRGKTLPSINSRRLGPINSRCCTFTRHYLQEATDPICLSTHVWCKPVLYYGLLHSCKTSKQHSLLH